MQQDPLLIIAGVCVTLAFFVLVGYVVSALPKIRNPYLVIASLAVLIGALPGILYALYG
jgi:hypothetical protein